MRRKKIFYRFRIWNFFNSLGKNHWVTLIKMWQISNPTLIPISYPKFSELSNHTSSQQFNRQIPPHSQTTITPKQCRNWYKSLTVSTTRNESPFEWKLETWPAVSGVVCLAESINEYTVIDAGCQRRCWMSITKLSEKTQASPALTLSLSQMLLCSLLLFRSRAISCSSPDLVPSTSHVEPTGSKWKKVVSKCHLRLVALLATLVISNSDCFIVLYLTFPFEKLYVQ